MVHIAFVLFRYLQNANAIHPPIILIQGYSTVPKPNVVLMLLT